MRADSHADTRVAETRTSLADRSSRQSSAAAALTPVETRKSAAWGNDSPALLAAKHGPYGETRISATELKDSISSNSSPVNESYELAGAAASAKCGETMPMKMCVRWLRFNFVGGIGIAVQFVALFLMKSILHRGYFAATALAVEAAVVHNFLWHERYTWADRLRCSSPSAPSRAEAQNNPWSALCAALKRCPTHVLVSPSCLRFLRFNFTTGAVSIAGNLALMGVMVGAGHMNYLVANAIAIALCSLANFVVSEQWVFAED